MNKTAFFRFTLTLVLLGLISHTAKPQDEKLKAIFVYNFTKYVNWPEKSGNFIITVLGRSAISAEIVSIAAKKMVGNSPIEVLVVSTPEEIAASHIVYVPASKTGALEVIKQKAADYHYLVISEKPDACKNGSCINFVNKDGKLSFEISKANLETNGLRVSSDLLKLGTVITN